MRQAAQLDFDRLRHGGRRLGSGRRPGPNPRIRHRSRGPIAGRFPCHVTLRVRRSRRAERARARNEGDRARLAKAVNRVFGRSGTVLADRYHVRALRTPREVRNALAYVLLNARRHAAKARRKLADAFAIDPASSGRWFDGWKYPVSSILGASGLSPPGSAAVSPPRSWLLADGWRLCGLLGPSEIPGH